MKSEPFEPPVLSWGAKPFAATTAAAAAANAKWIDEK